MQAKKCFLILDIPRIHILLIITSQPHFMFRKPPDAVLVSTNLAMDVEVFLKCKVTGSVPETQRKVLQTGS